MHHLNRRRDAGSSPPARGTRLREVLYLAHDRFIPACAGNTAHFSAYSSGVTVHPRLRGEHARGRRVLAPTCGSSPPARGTRATLNAWDDGSRFIPACAGNTSTCLSIGTAAAVHPRLRGEHWRLSFAFVAVCGSSPPARGTRPLAARICAVRRFIPACAGNTGLVDLAHGMFSGSSPPARGTPVVSVGTGATERFIPACAGNT